MQNPAPQSPRERVVAVNRWLDEQIIGQQKLTRRLLQALVCGGHLLVEGAPGLAKTRAVKDLSLCLEGDFHRIQFTPDLLPSDVTGTEVYRPEDGSFRFQKGPIFHNLVLADEVNRAPPKVQSALLEAMAEHQVSVGRQTFPLPELFFVMATQNPLEQEGTFPLPEAQLDRFLLQVDVPFPDAGAEQRILRLVRGETARAAAGQAGEGAPRPDPPARLTSADLAAIRLELTQLHMGDPVEQYLVALVMTTRLADPVGGRPSAARAPGGETAPHAWLACGVSPRGTLALDLLARSEAWLDGRDFVTPDDVRAVVHDVLRHRLLLGDAAYAEGVTADDVVDRLLATVPVA